MTDIQFALGDQKIDIVTASAAAVDRQPPEDQPPVTRTARKEGVRL
jgi:hypothetical protein